MNILSYRLRVAVRSGQLAFWLLVAFCLVPAQTSPAQDTNRDSADNIEELPEVADPLLDQKVESVLSKVSAWRARMKKEHFTAYLIAYTALFGAAVGGIYGFVAFRFGDSLAPYRRVRRRTLLLSTAAGFGLGVFVAVMQVPPTIKGKVSMLLLTIACSTLTTTASALLVFVVQRRLRLAWARRSGIPTSDRLRAP